MGDVNFPNLANFVMSTHADIPYHDYGMVTYKNSVFWRKTFFSSRKNHMAQSCEHWLAVWLLCHNISCPCCLELGIRIVWMLIQILEFRMMRFRIKDDLDPDSKERNRPDPQDLPFTYSYFTLFSCLGRVLYTVQCCSHFLFCSLAYFE